MSTVSYVPNKDELMIKCYPIKGKSLKEIGQFKIWFDEQGIICALAIENISKELKEFKKAFKTLRLKGIWKGIKITEKDIKEARLDLLNKLEEKW
jgi:hypothetical protein